MLLAKLARRFLFFPNNTSWLLYLTILLIWCSIVSCCNFFQLSAFFKVQLSILCHSVIFYYRFFFSSFTNIAVAVSYNPVSFLLYLLYHVSLSISSACLKIWSLPICHLGDFHDIFPWPSEQNNLSIWKKSINFKDFFENERIFCSPGPSLRT